MGFIDWQGDKQDHYEEILAFAKRKEQMESSEILKLLLKEKMGMDMLYNSLVQQVLVSMQLHIEPATAEQFYHDFWRYSIEGLVQQTKMDEKRKHQFADVILKKILKVNNRISAEEHNQKIVSSESYRQYLSRGFELKSGKLTLFWQWLGCLVKLFAKEKEGIQFIKLYQCFMEHFACYVSQLVQDASIEKRYEESKRLNEAILQKSFLEGAKLSDIEKNMRNPILALPAKTEHEKTKAGNTGIGLLKAAEVSKEQLAIGFLEKEDMEAYLAGIKGMIDAMYSEKLSGELRKMVQSLEYLSLALKKYPSAKTQASHFLSYYIPEAVKIFYEYHEYEKAGLEEQKINPLCRKAAAAIQKVSEAAKQQTAEIYKKEIRNTTARADALTEILEQDGYASENFFNAD